METLEKQVGRARRRLFIESLGGRLARCWFVTLLVAALAVGLGKLGLLPRGEAATLGWLAAALAAGLAAALTWTWLRRGSALQAAVEIDRRFGLKERVSSSLALEPRQRETDVGQALVRDAEHQLRAVDVAEQFGLRPDRRALAAVVPAAVVFCLAALVPLGRGEAPAKNTASPTAQPPARPLAARLQDRRKEAAERGLQEIEPLLAQLEQGVKQLAESRDSDRKKTLVALNDLVQDARQRRRALAGSADLKRQLSGLKDLHQGPADRFGQALRRGDIDEAARQLETLQQDLAAARLAPAAQQALAKQLAELQQAIAERARAQEQMARQLERQIEAQRRAGNLARADRLQRQLDQLRAQRPQMEQLGRMREQLEQAAACMNNGECDQAAAALAQMGQQLAGMQKDLQEMEMLDDALDQVADCKKAMACGQCDGQGCAACQGDDWARHDGPLNDLVGRRGGGKGIGVGLGPGLGPETNPDSRFYDSRVKQQPGRGAAKVVGQADGPNRKGRVQQEIQAEFSGGPQNAADALSEQRLPRDYREHAKRYFDALREGTN